MKQLHPLLFVVNFSFVSGAACSTGVAKPMNEPNVLSGIWTAFALLNDVVRGFLSRLDLTTTQTTAISVALKQHGNQEGPIHDHVGTFTAVGRSHPAAIRSFANLA